ncbi:P-loop containing nucleoside triphosphate hydrolase protein [Mucor lusitanicus]|uniref:P-loop containing nucleoside triphosphate hydrolase protein n=2 Tax=Mucor circinelloides f. lusitanicus TaxID=29924 RepID=A0A168LQ10_MUCCL|nr:P-loop containing nucleoside triphosphate hydrolase protein [Mucor lusitanicus]OAD03816.1 hypothetical protein MUCCIDRAFT_73791 [Mucor lusitanicus CBS 277.49]
MASLEVIGAGFGRTGTDSLRTALNMLGYKTHHMKSFREDPELNDPDDFYNAYDDREHANWDHMYRGYTAAVDWPTAAFWLDLHVKYPKAKIILTVRDADSWYTSVKNTIASYQQHSNAPEEDPNHPRFKMARMAQVTCLDGRLKNAEVFSRQEEIKQLFLNHNEEVKRIVPADQLLVMELGEGWDRLCAFLDKDVPNVPYPNVNSTLEHQKLRAERK